eukprot:768399-Hanusia_phi.AAC.9
MRIRGGCGQWNASEVLGMKETRGGEGKDETALGESKSELCEDPIQKLAHSSLPRSRLKRLSIRTLSAVLRLRSNCTEGGSPLFLKAVSLELARRRRRPLGQRSPHREVSRWHGLEEGPDIVEDCWR